MLLQLQLMYLLRQTSSIADRYTTMATTEVFPDSQEKLLDASEVNEDRTGPHFYGITTFETDVLTETTSTGSTQDTSERGHSKYTVVHTPRLRTRLTLRYSRESLFVIPRTLFVTTLQLFVCARCNDFPYRYMLAEEHQRFSL